MISQNHYILYDIMDSNISTDIIIFKSEIICWHISYMSWCHHLISMHYILMSCHDVIIWFHRFCNRCHAMKSIHEIIHTNRIFARALARSCSWFRGFAVYFKLGASPPIAPSSPESFASCSSSAPTELVLALGAGRTSGYKEYHSVSLSWRKVL